MSVLLTNVQEFMQDKLMKKGISQICFVPSARNEIIHTDEKPYIHANIARENSDIWFL